ncbi:hypothetical protein D8B26_002683 [Coccidioides posadasii str. Silveira]|uniref:uncharacterized protein n=1 Tax=Coccidioides posadasii (strain RMSCC 757 / Silveira) TaxID=443226 RepID=UPI001BEECBD2|nr:hypothetical protein D8B26_002683 [Coccidioides posadasii str. Silveira]
MIVLVYRINFEYDNDNLQIWFQNRRQNDRRRSKPLPPHDLGSSSTTTTDYQKDRSDNDVNSRPSPSQLSFSSQDEKKSMRLETYSPDVSVEHPDNECIEESGMAHATSSQTTVASTQTEELETTSCPDEAIGSFDNRADKLDPVSKDVQQRSGCKRKWDEYDVKEVVEAKYARRSLPSQLATPPSLRISLSFDGEAMVRMEGEKTPSPPKPRDSLRISFSADGEAVVRTANEPSPSKSACTNARQARFGHLRRSTSAISFPMMRSRIEGKDIKPFGRSRNARTWELYCDDDARTALPNALNTRVDSTSVDNLSPCGPQRENSKPLGVRSHIPNEIQEPQTPAEKRRKLTRAVSSLARLETGAKAPTSSGAKARKFAHDMKDHTGDSDKENWIPGTQISSVRRRGVQKQTTQARGRRVLGRSSKQLEASQMGVSRLRRTKSARSAMISEKNENGSAVAGESEETSAFVKEAGSNPEEDLDCVQGLLSLSQGAWR